MRCLLCCGLIVQPSLLCFHRLAVTCQPARSTQWRLWSASEYGAARPKRFGVCCAATHSAAAVWIRHGRRPVVTENDLGRISESATRTRDGAAPAPGLCPDLPRHYFVPAVAE